MALGEADAASLAQARLQLHVAAQAAALAGRVFAEAEPDWGHVGLYPASDGVLMSRPVGQTGLATGVSVASGEVVAADGSGELGRLTLDGETLDSTIGWLRRSVSEAGMDGAALEIDHEKLPDHGLKSGGAFELARRDNELAELAAWFSAGAEAVGLAASVFETASPVRVWPHHFDVASAIAIPEKGDDALLTIGMSPGDEGYAEPYFYATFWPYPPEEALGPPPEGGHWHSEGWVGAVLKGLGAAPPEERRPRVMRFIKESIEALV